MVLCVLYIMFFFVLQWLNEFFFQQTTHYIMLINYNPLLQQHQIVLCGISYNIWATKQTSKNKQPDRVQQLYWTYWHLFLFPQLPSVYHTFIIGFVWVFFQPAFIAVNKFTSSFNVFAHMCSIIVGYNDFIGL